MPEPMPLKDVKRHIREKYALSYEIFFITHDGGILCCDCARKNYKEIVSDYKYHPQPSCGWRVMGADCEANIDEAVQCDHCNKSIGPEEEEDETLLLEPGDGDT